MRSVCIDVAVADSIGDHVLPTAADARARMERDLTASAHDWGLPVRLDVVFEIVAADHLRGQPLRVAVAGRRCPVPAQVAADALAYANRTFPDRTSWESAMAVMAPEARHDALALIVREAVAAHPEVLVPPDDPLAELLRHGISVAGEDLDALRDRIRTSGVGAELDRLASPTVDLLIEPAYLRTLTTDADGGELFAFMRDGLFEELGFGLPPMRVCFEPDLPERGLAFRINATRTLPHIGLAPDTILVNDTVERLRLLAVEGRPAVNPGTGQPGALVSGDKQEMLESAGLTTWSPFGCYILVLAATLRARIADLVTPARVRDTLAQLGKAFPAVAASVPQRDVGDLLTPLLRALLAEGISVHNLRQVVQLTRRHAVAPELTDGLDLLSFVRSGMADAIGKKASRGTGTVVVYILDPEFEHDLAKGEPADDALAEEIRNAFQTELRHLPPTAQVPCVLTTHRNRVALRDVLRDEHPSMTVLAYTDLPAGVNVQPVARISR
jgi:type III secretory pathway component EscV